MFYEFSSSILGLFTEIVMDCSESASRSPLLEVTFIHFSFILPLRIITFSYTDVCMQLPFTSSIIFTGVMIIFWWYLNGKGWNKSCKNLCYSVQGAYFLYFKLINIFNDTILSAWSLDNSLCSILSQTFNFRLFFPFHRSRMSKLADP